jgi:hypothetical protein
MALLATNLISDHAEGSHTQNLYFIDTIYHFTLNNQLRDILANYKNQARNPFNVFL